MRFSVRVPVLSAATHQTLHAERERGRGDGGQPFRNRRDGQRHRRAEHVHGRDAAQETQYQRCRTSAEGNADEAAAQAIELALEGRRRRAHLRHERPDPAQLAVAAQPGHARERRALRHRRARVHHVAAVAERRGGRTERLRRFRDGKALARQRGFVDAEPVGREQTRVGRDVVAGAQDDEVARRQRGRRDHALDAVAPHDRLRNGGVLQRGEDALDAALGGIADGGVGGDDGEDYRGVEHRAAQQREGGRAAEQDHRQRGEVVAHDRRAGFRPVHRQHVAAVRETASLGLGHREARLG